jgi:hypothetical protein
MHALSFFGILAGICGVGFWLVRDPVSAPSIEDQTSERIAIARANAAVAPEPAPVSFHTAPALAAVEG